MSSINTFNKISYLLIAATIFLVPLFFLPITKDFYEWNKSLLLLFADLALIAIWIARNFRQREITIKRTAFDLPLFGLLAVTIVSALISPDPITALTGRTLQILSITLFYFALCQTTTDQTETKKWLTTPLITSATLLAILTLLQQTGLPTRLVKLTWFNAEWTPTGDQFGQAALVFGPLLFLISQLQQWLASEERTKFGIKEILSIISGFLLIGALVIFVQKSFLSTSPLQLEFARPTSPTAWRVATAVMGENLKATFLGVGPENFSAAYLQYRPITTNQTALWNVTFFKSADEPLHLLTTIGLLGLIGWGALVFAVIKRFRINPKSYLPIVGTIALQILLPSSFITWFVLVTFLAASEAETERQLSLKIDPTTALSSLVTVSAIMGYFIIHAYRGETAFYQSLQELRGNQINAAYKLQLAAIKENPKNYQYRQAFSQTNRVLANALLNSLRNSTNTAEQQASEENTKKQQQTVKIIQQSITEAKEATILSPHRSETWRNLADIYRALIGSMDGAQDWAIAAYQKAVSLNPNDPDLRISLGGVYYGLGAWEEALYSFRTAVTVKPDHANAWYNLAATYKMSGENQKAATALQNVIKILPTDDANQRGLQQELNDLKKTLTQEATPPTQPTVEGIEKENPTLFSPLLESGTIPEEIPAEIP